jgi:hypothetical protein
MTLKTCNHCHEQKPLSSFCKWSRMPDGLANRCKECSKKYASASYDKHREEILLKQKIKRMLNRKPRVKKIPKKKVPVYAPPPPVGSITKKCRKCKHPVFVMPGETLIQCDKCFAEMKVLIRSGSRRNIGGIRLEVTA